MHIPSSPVRRSAGLNGKDAVVIANMAMTDSIIPVFPIPLYFVIQSVGLILSFGSLPSLPLAHMDRIDDSLG